MLRDFFFFIKKLLLLSINYLIMKSFILLFFTLFLSLKSAFSQKPQKLSSNQIFEKIEKLNFLGTALYVAAHPDDENTRLIAFLANKVKARTGYLSLTRGDGGQNLIGSEIRELLGVIRTQELLAARSIDGGEQLFTRANDFGYSKHPDETLKIWNKNEVLADVVWAIRTFKPDIVINRFNHRTPGTTHGHHTSSAILSVQAFDLAGDKDKFPAQLKNTSVWSPKKLFFNTSSWFYKSESEFKKATLGKLLSLEVGNYYPLKGLSNNELASMASSQHLCQGFGRLSSRGSQSEYLEILKGDKVNEEASLFSGINTTWSRLENGSEIGLILEEIEENFNFKNPQVHLSALLKAFVLIQNLKDPHWRMIKEKQIKEIIEACAGLYIEAVASSATAVPDSNIDVNFELLNRSNANVTLVAVRSYPSENTFLKDIVLATNTKLVFKEKIRLKEINYSSPYWLQEPASLGMYKVSDSLLIGKPETPRPIRFTFDLLIENIPISINKDIVRKYAEKDKGEVYEPFDVLPKITTNIKDKVLLFPDEKSKKIAVEVRAGVNNIQGNTTLNVPNGWRFYPEKQPFNIQQKGDRQIVFFTIYPPKNASEGTLKVVALSNDEIFEKEMVEINYSHIPKQRVLLNSEAKIVRLDIQTAGKKIGYIMGAGDAIPESLQQIGYKVTVINPALINENNLQMYDAVILGIRAYNVVTELKFKQKFLLDYVAKGGTMVVQYNTNRGVNVLAPYTLNLSRDRVTDEFSDVRFLNSEHPLLNYPNKITSQDFEDWVQERGLYFPNSWSSDYTPVLSIKDKGETAKNGSLLIAKYGKGNYIYTGLSFFRELPAGVSGAYRLFANILAVGKK